MMRKSFHAAALAAVAVAGMSFAARAQTEPADPHHPNATVAQSEPSAQPDGAAGGEAAAQPGGAGTMSGTMPDGTMPQGAMPQGAMPGGAMPGGNMMGGNMMGGMMQPGMMGGMMRGMMQPGMMGGMTGGMPMMAMRGHMLKMMFAIADADGDDALSFDEITAVHQRIFNKVDADKNGKVTREEVQTFMQD